MGFDEALVDELHDNGRLSISELARRLNAPRRRVQERMHELLSSGAMRISANVHPALLGMHAYGHVLIWVEGAASPVLTALRGLREAPFISAVSGHCDIVVEVGAGDHGDLAALLARIREIPGVREVAVSQLLRIFKSRFETADTLTETTFSPPDDIDTRIISLLRKDGRMPYSALGEEVGLSIGAVRARVTRMTESGLLRIACVLRTAETGRRVQIGAGIRTRGDTRHLLEALHENPNVDFAAVAIGEFDLVVTLSGWNARGAFGVLDGIRAMPGISRVTSWAHLDVVRESYE